MSHSLTHYLDVRIRPDPEFAMAHLMNALYAKLHRALYDAAAGKPGGIAVSFPQQRGAKGWLGDVVRLHGTGQSLQALMTGSWLTGMSDHVECSPIAPVPASCTTHRAVCRVDVQSNPEKLRRRWLKRHPGESEAKARQYYPDAMAQRSPLAYLALRSRSTGQHYRLYLEQRPASAKPGHYSPFGLSLQGSTVPWF